MNITRVSAHGPAPELMATDVKVVPSAPPSPGTPASAPLDTVPPVTVLTIRCRCLVWLKLFPGLEQCTCENVRVAVLLVARYFVA